MAAWIRITQGDLTQTQADVLVLSTRGVGTYEHKGVSGQLATRLSETFPKEEPLAERIRGARRGRALKTGEASLLARPEVPPSKTRRPRYPHLVLANPLAGPSGGATPATIAATTRAVLELLDAERELVGPSPVVAFPLLGAGRGDEGDRAAAAAMGDAFAARRDFAGELVLVVWSPGAFRACFEELARRGLLQTDPGAVLEGASGASCDDRRLRGLVDVLTERRSFLFIGSGFSYNADPRMPGWGDLFPTERKPAAEAHVGALLAGLAKKAGESISADEWWELRGYVLAAVRASYPDCAQAWADASVSRAAFERAFCSPLDISACPSVLHSQLLSLPWAGIITTNYDDLIERTLGLLRRDHLVVTEDRQIADLDRVTDLPVVKLHGGFPQAGDPPGKRRPSSLIATRDDYDRFFELRPALAAYLESRLLTSRGLIVGYGLADPHLSALFARIGSVRPQHDADPRLICLATDPSATEEYWRARGMETIVAPVRNGGPYARFLDAVTNAAHQRLHRALVPETFFTGEDWKRVSRLDEEARTTLVAALLDVGCVPPKRELGLIAKLLSPDGEHARRHLSPERRTWLRDLRVD